MKQMKMVTVFKQEEYDEEWMPENLINAIEWLQEHLKSIPEQYRNDAQIKVDSLEKYGNPYAKIKINYEREETDEEELGRIKLETANEKHRNRLEIAELKRLQEKYGVLSV